MYRSLLERTLLIFLLNRNSLTTPFLFHESPMRIIRKGYAAMKETAASSREEVLQGESGRKGRVQ